MLRQVAVLRRIARQRDADRRRDQPMRFVGRVVAHHGKHDLPGRQVLQPFLLAEQFAVGRKNRFDAHEVELGDSCGAQRQLERSQLLAMPPHALGQKVPFGIGPIYFRLLSDAAFFYTNPPAKRYTVFTGEYSPNTWRIASEISPSVHHPRTASTIGGIRLSPSRAAASTRASAFVAASAFRSARTRATPAFCFASSSGLTCRYFARRCAAPGKLVDPYDNSLLRFNLALVNECRVLNFALHVAALDRRDRAAEVVDLRQVLDRLLLRARSSAAST